MPAQRAFGGRIGRVSIILVMGEEYAAHIRSVMPVLPAVLHITNGEPGILVLSREKDEVVARRRDGVDFPRIDVWSSADLLPILGKMPAAERSRFRYPDFVLSNAAVEHTIAFDPTLTFNEIESIWVRLSTLPSQGVRLEALPSKPGPP